MVILKCLRLNYITVTRFELYKNYYDIKLHIHWLKNNNLFNISSPQSQSSDYVYIFRI